MYSPWTVNSPAFLYRDSFNSPGKHKDNLFIGHRHDEAYTKCVLRDSLAFSTSRVNSIPAAAFNWYLWAPKTIPFCWETRFDFSLPNTQCVYMGCWINWTRNLWGESKCDAYCVAGRKWSALRGHLDVYGWKFHQGIENASLETHNSMNLLHAPGKLLFFGICGLISSS
jgi:hypothetical protein